MEGKEGHKRLGCNEGWRERRDTRDWDVMKGGGKGGREIMME